MTLALVKSSQLFLSTDRKPEFDQVDSAASRIAFKLWRLRICVMSVMAKTTTAAFLGHQILRSLLKSLVSILQPVGLDQGFARCPVPSQDVFDRCDDAIRREVCYVVCYSRDLPACQLGCATTDVAR